MCVWRGKGEQGNGGSAHTIKTLSPQPVRAPLTPARRLQGDMSKAGPADLGAAAATWVRHVAGKPLAPLSLDARARALPFSFSLSPLTLAPASPPIPPSFPLLQSGGRLLARGADAYDAALVARIYRDHLASSSSSSSARRGPPGAPSSAPHAAQALEHSSYLEFYLWPFFTPDVSFEHVMSMVMVRVGGRKRGGESAAGGRGPEHHPTHPSHVAPPSPFPPTPADGQREGP
jgi:hypothetical protein